MKHVPLKYHISKLIVTRRVQNWKLNEPTFIRNWTAQSPWQQGTDHALIVLLAQ